MLKRIFLSLLFGGISFCSLFSMHLEVGFCDGTSSLYLIDGESSIKFDGELFVYISSQSTAERLPADNISYYRYIDKDAFVVELGAEGVESFTVENHCVICRVTTANSKVEIYTVNGENVATFDVVESKENIFSLQHLSPGVYIVSLNNKSVKILL